MTENTCPVCGHNHSKAHCLALAPDQYSRHFCGCDGERFHSIDCEIWELQDAIEAWCERTTTHPDNWRLVASPRGWTVQRVGYTLFADEVPVLRRTSFNCPSGHGSIPPRQESKEARPMTRLL